MLIHSATGGVGQAAIAIARMADAEIYATAGTHRRREMLRRMGIAHVYDSRSVDFAEEIRRDTDGYGVDIVLNSLTGAARRAGVELLAFGGRFVEIGKKDIYGDTRMGPVPVPSQPVLLRCRPGADVYDASGADPRTARHRVPAYCGGLSAAARKPPTTRLPTPRPPSV